MIEVNDAGDLYFVYTTIIYFSTVILLLLLLTFIKHILSMPTTR